MIYRHLRTITGVILSSFMLINTVSADDEIPRIIVFKSTYPTLQGKICLGHVKTEEEGKPVTIVNFGITEPLYCKDSLAAFEQGEYLKMLATIRVQFSSLMANASNATETLLTSDLSTRIFSPVPTSQDELDNESVFVIGVGLNYMDHRDETGMDTDDIDWRDLLFFPKTIAPSKPYGTISQGLKIRKRYAEDVELLDYEVEVGIVLLNDIDLKEPLNRQTFYQNVAYFVANDLSDREPIILDQKAGYTQGKTHPGYFPTGPWLVFSESLPTLFSDTDSTPLSISLKVEKDNKTQSRQSSTTDYMIWKPAETISVLARHFQTGNRICMRDATGEARYLYSEEGIIPAGSLILTGTSGGTAIQKPKWYEKLHLFVEGGFTLSGAAEEYVEDQESESEEHGFLHEGDIMITAVEKLGTQRHTIKKSKNRVPYGVSLAAGECSYKIRRDQ